MDRKIKEIGGYIELDEFKGTDYHKEASLALNCGRNCLAYLIKVKNIKKIKLPYFLCSSVRNICEKYNVKIGYYHISKDFFPKEIELEESEWLYIVNYYGQLTNVQIIELQEKYGNIIVDYAQSYFQKPVEGIDTLYTCRKYFGVADGAYLYSTKIDGIQELLQDESFERMHFLLGRYERTASEFYHEYAENNEYFTTEPIKLMSKLTANLLRAVDYDFVKKTRTENFKYLHSKLKKYNKLSLTIPEGAFMYPFYIKNGKKIREKLLQEQIYIPTLWPDVFKLCNEEMLEWDMAENILPLPIDQRYSISDMEMMCRKILGIIEKDIVQ